MLNMSLLTNIFYMTVGPGVPVDAMPAPGDGAPGLSMGGIAGWRGGALLAVHWNFLFLFVVSPTFSIPCM